MNTLVQDHTVGLMIVINMNCAYARGLQSVVSMASVSLSVSHTLILEINNN